MSDDMWQRDDDGRRRPGKYEAEMDEFDAAEFGGPLFGDTSEQPTVAPKPAPPSAAPAAPQTPSSPAAGSPIVEPTAAATSGDAGDERLSLDGDSSGAMPHWTEAATGEVPRIEAPAAPDPTDDLDVWSTFTSASPVWKEGDAVDAPTGVVAETPSDPTGELSWEDAPAEVSEEAPVTSAQVSASDGVAVVTAASAAAAPDSAGAPVTAPREPSRITIGTDPSGMPRRPDSRTGAVPQRPPGAPAATPGSDARNLPIAVASGLLLAAGFLALTNWRPAGALAFVVVALGLASIEYFGKVTEKGYRPAVAAGVLATICAPLAAYWLGEVAIPLVLMLAFVAAAASFVGATSLESGPMPNMAITMLGIVWIGLMGSFAALILRFSTAAGGTDWGTDTLVLAAVGVVANDVGAYFAGSAFGRTPLRAWISPGKSVEGFLGGTILTLLVMLIVGMRELSDTWSSMSHLLVLGIVISLAAPLGDLTESMFKRNLDVKDFGTLIKGHGGVLDRFDGFLITLPAVYYVMLVLEPWGAAGL